LKHVDTQTDMTKLVRASLQLFVANAPRVSLGRTQCVWVSTVLQVFTSVHYYIVQHHKVLTRV